MPTRAKMLADGGDEPLFQEKVRERQRRHRKPGSVAYRGPRSTCHVCLVLVERGEQLKFQRSRAEWSVLLDSGREWLVCALHKADVDTGALKLASL